MKRLENGWVIFGLALVLLVVQATYYGIVHFTLNDSESPVNPGTFGDTFGGLNVTFTGLAFLGLLYSVAVQKKQIRDTESENRYLRDAEYKRDFENTFFQLLKIFMDIRKDIVTQDSRRFIDLWKLLREQVVFGFSKLVEKHEGDLTEDKKALPVTEHLFLQRLAVRKECEAFFEDRNFLLGHYFRALYYILRQINLSKLETSDRHLYADILRAQLSSYELLVIFFNGISPQGRKLRNLMNQFGTLKHLDLEDIFHPELEVFYRESAYERPRYRLEFTKKKLSAS